jgi:hypothetical protein
VHALGFDESHPLWVVRRRPNTLNTRDQPPSEFSHRNVCGLARGRVR